MGTGSSVRGARRCHRSHIWCGNLCLYPRMVVVKAISRVQRATVICVKMSIDGTQTQKLP
jgi:hypothetical protein